MALQQAKRGVKTFFFSLETNVHDLLNRCAAIELPISLLDLTEGRIGDDECGAVQSGDV